MNELDWIAEAKKHLGKREVGNTNTSKDIEQWQQYLLGFPIKKGHYLYGVAWCGTFVAYCLKKCGLTIGNSIPTNWFRALDYTTKGTLLKAPCYGCVAIKTREGGGHVTFVVGKTKQGKLVCLGGNQGNSVCYATYDVSSFKEFRWYGKTSTPLQERYNLPILGISNGNVTES